MARNSAAASLSGIIDNAVRPVVARTSNAISRAVASMVAKQLEAELRASALGRKSRRNTVRTRATRVEITRWVADRRARRVPTFVIEATGLDTKKKIVAKYGAGAIFHKGRPLPRVK